MAEYPKKKQKRKWMWYLQTIIYSLRFSTPIPNPDLRILILLTHWCLILSIWWKRTISFFMLLICSRYKYCIPASEVKTWWGLIRRSSTHTTFFKPLTRLISAGSVLAGPSYSKWPMIFFWPKKALLFCRPISGPGMLKAHTPIY